MKLLSLSALALTSTLLSSALLGCMDEESGEPTFEELTPVERAILGGDGKPAATAKPGLGETSQQLTAWGLFPFSCTSGACYPDVGTFDNRTCFLAGLGGDLRDGYVFLSRQNGSYRLEMNPATGKTITANVVCVNGDTNYVYQSWFTDNPANRIYGTVTSKRRCFLAGVLNTGSYNALDNPSDYVRAWKDSANQWWLGGSVTGSADALVTAVCIDTDDSMGVWGVPGPANGNLAYDPGSPNGVACGVSKLGGSFISATGSDGAHIDYNFGTRYWTADVDTNKNAEILCVR